MSQRDIKDMLREIYGLEVSQGLISHITNKILPEVNEWQNRPLDKIYPVVFFKERFEAWRTRALPSSSRGLSDWKIPVKKKQRIITLLLPYILQLALGRSSALPCLAALLLLVKMVADNRIYTVYFSEQECSALLCRLGWFRDHFSWNFCKKTFPILLFTKILGRCSTFVWQQPTLCFPSAFFLFFQFPLKFLHSDPPISVTSRLVFCLFFIPRPMSAMKRSVERI